MVCYLFKAKDSLGRLFVASRCCDSPQWIKNNDGTYSPGNNGTILISAFKSNIGTITSIETKKDLNDITKDSAYFTDLNCSNCLISGCYAFKALDSFGIYRIYFNCCSDPGWLVSRSNSAYFEPVNNGNYLRSTPGWQTEKGEILFIRNSSEIHQLVRNTLIDDGSTTPYYYYNYSKYLLSNPGTWQNSQDQAASLGGNLTSILDQKEQDFIIENFGNSKVYWIGLIPNTVTTPVNGVQWVDGKPFEYENWSYGENSSSLALDSNVRFALNYSQFDNGKWAKLTFTSGLGKFYLLSDIGTWENCQNQAVSINANLVKIDSLTKQNYLVGLYGSTTAYWIGLSDKLNDGIFRWTDGTTPSYTNWTTGQPVNDAGNIQYVYMNYLAAGKWYPAPIKTYSLTSAGTWEDSQDSAIALGGNLVTIENSARQSYLQTTFGTSERFWIGLTDRETEGTFKWISGYPVTYTNWATGQPDQALGANENYAVMNQTSTTGKWADYTNNQSFRGIVEKPFSNIKGIIEADSILVQGIIKIPYTLNYCSSCLNYKNFPNIKANRTTIQLPDYQNFLQVFGNTDYIAKSGQSVGANAEINLYYELLNKEQKQTLENFYTFSNNQGFLVDLNILRIPQDIKDAIANWKTLAFFFKSAPVIKPRFITKQSEIYDIDIVLESRVS